MIVRLGRHAELGARHPGGSVVAVTHGGVIQSVLPHLWERRSLPSGSVADGSVHELLMTGARLQVVCSDAETAAAAEGARA